jgi:hypothetical protein
MHKKLHQDVRILKMPYGSYEIVDPYSLVIHHPDVRFALDPNVL